MTGRIFNIQKFCLHDGPGIRTTVFLRGCPLACWWCHNPESQARGPERALRPDRCIRCGECVEACDAGALSMGSAGPVVDPDRCTVAGDCAAACPTTATEVVGRVTDVAAVVRELRRDRPFYEESGGGATFSGGEPLLQPEFLEALLEACRADGIHTTVDTSGYAPAGVLDRIAALADAVLFDVKVMDDAAHRRFTGVSNHRILDNLRRLSRRQRERGGPDVTIRVPLVAGLNDSDDDAGRLAAFLADLDPRPPVNLLPYQPLGRSKYERFGVEARMPDARPPSHDRLATFTARLRDAGLHVT